MARFRAMPYAKALHEVVRADGPARSDAVIEELDRVAAALDAVPDFLRVLTTPMVAVETKTQILDEVLSSLEITQPARRFAHVVQQHYRMEHMRDIATVYRELVDRGAGRARAKIEVAGELDEEQRRRVRQVMTEVLGTDVVAEFNNNPELLAGFRVQVGSKVFDGSLIGQVDRLSRETVME
jgi:F-type H+-transporting ATPase subunit delta